MPNVSFVREEVKKLIRQYEMIADCILGEAQIKYRQQRYLPMPNADDQSPYNLARYTAYLSRAVFYNVVQTTVLGLVGQIFLRDPNCDVPTLLDDVVADATGSGVSLDQLAQALASYVLPFGRAGLFVDFPDVDAPATKADIEEGTIRPTIAVIAPWDCLNWRIKKRGAKLILSLVVFREEYTLEDDGFEVKTKVQYRVLRLIDDVYTVEIYRDSNVQPFAQYTPLDNAGVPLNEIPFTFVGSKNNDPQPAQPPLYSMASLNIAHFRNSADYEEAVYMLGQPTAYFSGLSEEWVTKVMGGVVRLGSRAAILLPVGGDAGLLQVEPNTLAKEAMDQKEGQMLALGAKLLESSQVERTATEANYDNISETSVLASIAKNCGAAIKWALEQAAKFVGATTEEISYDMNTEFDLVNLTPEERKTLLAEWQAGAITFEEYRASLRRAGIAYLDDVEAKSQVEAEQAAMMEAAVAEAAAMTEATTVPEPPVAK